MAADHTVLPVLCDAGEIAHVLVGTGQLVEQGGLAAVLVADQRKGQLCAVRQGIAAAPGMETAFFTQAGMLLGTLGFLFLIDGFLADRGNFNLLRVCKAESQLISVDPQLHGVSHRSQFDNGNFRTGDDAHVQEMLAQGAFTADGFDNGGLAGVQRVKFHIGWPFLCHSEHRGKSGILPDAVCILLQLTIDSNI